MARRKQVEETTEEATEETQVDMINNPPHYTQGGIECIDAIKAALGHDGFIAFLRGQIIRYNWWLPHKEDPMADAAKAQWYQDRLVTELSLPQENTDA